MGTLVSGWVFGHGSTASMDGISAGESLDLLLKTYPEAAKLAVSDGQFSFVLQKNGEYLDQDLWQSERRSITGEGTFRNFESQDDWTAYYAWLAQFIVVTVTMKDGIVDSICVVSY